MRFGKLIKENEIKEWKDFYINYKSLKSLLKPFKQGYKTFIKKYGIKYSWKIHDIEFNEQREKLLNMDIETERFLQLNFEDQFINELKKVDYFFSQNINYYEKKLKKIEVKYLLYLLNIFIYI
jgi:hypothetical protein